jgi:hypothetical protein
VVTTTAALAATGLPAGPAMLAGPESDKAGPLGLLTIVLLGIAVYFLYRSMARHIKKVPASFDPPPDEHAGGGAAAPGSASSAAPVPDATAEPPGVPPGVGPPGAGAPAERPARPPVDP